MFEWGKRTFIMGIMNLTPDSFSGDGTLINNDPIKFAIAKAEQFIRDGADILDIGAESSRPGSVPISADDELARILPVLKSLKKSNLDRKISIDTYKASVAKECLENGADWINDIWGLRKCKELANVISHFQVPVVLMHNRSRDDAVNYNQQLGASYEGAEYTDFIDEIKRDLLESVSIAVEAGIKKDKIVLDPGIGFGKTVTQNLMLINQLDEIKVLGYPVLIGPSRKSFIGQTLDLRIEERIEGTAASISVGITKGADIVRVHDVQYMSRLVKMTDAIIQSGLTN